MTYTNTRLFINGQWCDADGGKTLSVVNPVTGLELGRVSCADKDSLDRALLAAQAGFDIWRNTPAVERSKIMDIAAINLRARAEQIATLMTLEQGKPLAEAKAEVLMAAEVTE